MNPLSVLLPIFNAHNNLDTNVADILELLGETTEPFELWLLDDGSTDDTAEMAHELSARYPQVRVLRHPVRLGLSESIQTGLDHMTAETMLLGSDDYDLDPNDLRALWRLRDAERRAQDEGLELDTFDDSRVRKLLAWSPRRPRGQKRGFQIIRRGAFEQFRLQHAAESTARIDFATRHTNPDLKTPTLARPKFMGRITRSVWDR